MIAASKDSKAILRIDAPATPLDIPRTRLNEKRPPGQKKPALPLAHAMACLFGARLSRIPLSTR
jgi:hypothetical protein